MQHSSVTLILIFGSASLSLGLNVTSLQTKTVVDGHIAILCHSDEPIDYCAFKRPDKTTWMTVDDMKFSEIYTQILYRQLYIYVGRGFDKGDCGLIETSASKSSSGNWECRVRTKWREVYLNGSVAIDVSDNYTNEVSVIPLQTTVDTNENMMFLCHADYEIKSCTIKPPNASDWIEMNSSNIWNGTLNEESQERHLYVGSGFEKGDCGLALLRARKEDEGEWQCKMEFDSDEEERIERIEVKVLSSEYITTTVTRDISFSETTVFFVVIIIILLILLVGSVAFILKQRRANVRNSKTTNKPHLLDYNIYATISDNSEEDLFGRD